MTERPKKSFSEVALTEAIARLTSVYITVKPVSPGSDRLLCSRFLATRPAGDLILAEPWAADKKVFLPVGWDLGIAFSVGEFILQARTRVLDHCQFRLHPTRHVDAMVVQRPDKLVSLNQRKHPRHEVDPSSHVMVSMWFSGDMERLRGEKPRIGRLLNRSQDGLGVGFDVPLPARTDVQVILRLEEKDAASCGIYRAVLKHCTLTPQGIWLAGLGEVTELGPGEAVPIMESLATPR